MTRSITSIALASFTLELLSLNSTTPMLNNLIVDGFYPTGSKSIKIKRPTDINSDISLVAGSSLRFELIGLGQSFLQQIIVLRESLNINSQSDDSELILEVLDLKEDLPNGAIAVVVSGMLPLFGIQGFDLQSQESTVDLTNTQSGSGMESANVRFDRTINISGVQLAGDKALETIVKPNIFSQWAKDSDDVFAIATYPNGEQYRGIAKIRNLTMAGNQNEVMRYEFNLQFQRDIERDDSIMSVLTPAKWSNFLLQWDNSVMVW